MARSKTMVFVDNELLLKTISEVDLEKLTANFEHEVYSNGQVIKQRTRHVYDQNGFLLFECEAEDVSFSVLKRGSELIYNSPYVPVVKIDDHGTNLIFESDNLPLAAFFGAYMSRRSASERSMITLNPSDMTQHASGAELGNDQIRHDNGSSVSFRPNGELVDAVFTSNRKTFKHATKCDEFFEWSGQPIFKKQKHEIEGGGAIKRVATRLLGKLMPN